MSVPKCVELTPNAETIEAGIRPGIPGTTDVSGVRARGQVRRRIHAAVVGRNIPEVATNVQGRANVRLEYRLNPRALPTAYAGLSYQTSIQAGTGHGLGRGSAFDCCGLVNPGGSEFSERDLSSGHG